MSKIKGKHWLLIVCLAIAAVFGLAAAALADMGGHKNLSDVCAAIAIVCVVPVGFLWVGVISELW